MTRTLSVRDECGVREVVKEKRKWQEDHGRDDDADHDRVRTTETRVCHHEGRRDCGEDRDLRDPVERVRAIDYQRIDARTSEKSSRESDDRENARVTDGIAKREQETQAERQQD